MTIYHLFLRQAFPAIPISLSNHKMLATFSFKPSLHFTKSVTLNSHYSITFWVPLPDQWVSLSCDIFYIVTYFTYTGTYIFEQKFIKQYLLTLCGLYSSIFYNISLCKKNAVVGSLDYIDTDFFQNSPNVKIYPYIICKFYIKRN